MSGFQGSLLYHFAEEITELRIHYDTPISLIMMLFQYKGYRYIIQLKKIDGKLYWEIENGPSLKLLSNQSNIAP